ncbi:hypothetical protein EXIGLDRAFT_728332 [Exidia glandulosa HHB12029]|uniref:F-box domain-containing protein n=1 Tax=Exidia glandulosa HHB12029 TaxID=1314781 RepID=A0A165LTR6_EXIGL|nr:hypothetical protein EXIGLDRAFT_728332 [Exidia glandulosa HHB12029]
MVRTKSPMRAVYRLPNELWSAIFGYLHVGELVPASKVCVCWRAVAFDHPNFWRNVRIDSAAKGKLYWTTRQLAAGGGRPFNLIVHMPNRMHGMLAQFVLQTIHASLSRVSGLRISLDSAHAPLLWAALAAPAPHLAKFELTLLDSASIPSETLPELASNIFARCAPRLRSVSLKEVALPMQPVPAFANADRVSIDALMEEWSSFVYHDPTDEWQDFPYHLFLIFPRVEQLMVGGGGFEFARCPPPHAVQGMQRLKSLHLSFDHGWDNIKFLEHFPTAHIPTVLVSGVDDISMRQMLSQLPSAPFHLSVYRTTPTEFHICVQSARDGSVRRIFVEDLKHYTRPEELKPSSVFRPETSGHLPFSQHVTALSVSTSLWGTVTRWMPTYPELTTLTLLVDAYRPLTSPLPKCQLACPKLGAVAVRSMSAHVANVDARAVADVIASTGQRRVKVQLAGVRLFGPPKMLAAVRGSSMN